MSVRYSIIVPTHEKSPHVFNCIESVMKFTENYELVFAVSKASQFSDELKTFGKVVIVPGTFIFARSVNDAIGFSVGENIVFLNDDVIVSAGWTKRMENAYKYFGAGLIGARCQKHGCSNPDAHEKGANTPTDYTVNLFAAMIPRRIQKILGPLDERFILYGGEDCDYTLRAHRNQIPVVISSALVEHKVSSSFGKDRIKHEIDDSREIFKDKWGVKNPVPPKESWADDKRSAVCRPLISVLMPTKNHARYIRSAIASVLDQNYKNFELLIGIDGQDPDTLLEIETFDDPRIRTFNFTSRGSCNVRNSLFLESEGEFIALQDSDDLMIPSRLQDQLARMRPETDIVYSSYVVESNTGAEPIAAYPLNIQSLLAMKNFVAGGTFFMRRYTLQEEPFDERFALAFDFEYVLRTFHKFHYTFSNENAIVYRRHNGQHLSGTNQSAAVHKELIRRYQDAR